MTNRQFHDASKDIWAILFVYIMFIFHFLLLFFLHEQITLAPTRAHILIKSVSKPSVLFLQIHCIPNRIHHEHRKHTRVVPQFGVGSQRAQVTANGVFAQLAWEDEEKNKSE